MSHERGFARRWGPVLGWRGVEEATAHCQPRIGQQMSPQVCCHSPMHEIVEVTPEALGISAFRVHGGDEFVGAGRDEQQISHRSS